MAANNKGNDDWVKNPLVTLVLAGVVVYLLSAGGCIGGASSKSSTSPESPARYVKTVDLDGVQFKIDAERRNIHPRLNDEVLAASVAVVRLYGYRCDTVNAAKPLGGFANHAGYRLYCNGWRYDYLIEDRGGRWTVTLD